MNKLLDVKETAALFGVTENSLRGMIRHNLVPFIKLSPKIIRFDLNELESFIEKRKVKPRR